jgi:hypothetical protein
MKTTFQSWSGPIDIDVSSVAGARGDTQTAPSPSAGGRIVQAFICVDPSPQVSGLASVQRDAGDPILLVVLVHEFIHACGLSGTTNFLSHTSMGDPDLFVAVLSDVVGRDPADDKEDVGSGKLVPSLFLANETVNRIKALWLVPDYFLHIHFPHTF